jgi:fumarate reductase subunit C
MTEIRIYIVQRVTALLMIPFILLHVAVIFHAISEKLTADQILARTGGSITWGLFYGAFVVLASVHGAIGIRTVIREWTPLDNAIADIFAIAMCMVLMILGMRAVAAVVFS